MLRDRNAKESWALLEDLALYHNESWNDPRDFAKLVKAIALHQDVPSTSDRRLIDSKINGPHDTQYCMEDPEQAFVEYASSRTDEAGGLVPQSSDTKVVCTKGDDEEVMFIELIRKNDDSSKREPKKEGSTTTEGVQVGNGCHVMDCVFFNQYARNLLGVSIDDLINKALTLGAGNPYWSEDYFVMNLYGERVVIEIKVDKFNLPSECSRRFTVVKYFGDHLDYIYHRDIILVASKLNGADVNGKHVGQSDIMRSFMGHYVRCAGLRLYLVFRRFESRFQEKVLPFAGRTHHETGFVFKGLFHDCLTAVNGGVMVFLVGRCRGGVPVKMTGVTGDKHLCSGTVSSGQKKKVQGCSDVGCGFTQLLYNR
nr:nucleic acid-binding, OB-fold protein [Tanacetum cinerariifolium]